MIVGSHHGSTPEYYSDIAEENIETYGKDVFFGQQKDKWEKVWKEWLDIALEKSGFSSVEELPDISMEVQDRTRLQIIMLIMGLMVSRRSRSMEQPI